MAQALVLETVRRIPPPTGRRVNGRRLVLDAVLAAPGIHKSEISETTGLAWGTTTYHVEQLLRAGAIRCHALRKEVLLHGANTSSLEACKARVLRNALASRIAHQLSSHGKMSVADLCLLLQSSRKAISRQLDALIGIGIVQRSEVRTRFELCPGLPMAPLPFLASFQPGQPSWHAATAIQSSAAHAAHAGTRSQNLIQT